jgi:MFS family permease
MTVAHGALAAAARRRFLGVVVAASAGYLSVGIVAPVLPGYVRGPLGGSDVVVGVVVGSVPMVMLLCRAPAGRLIDTRGSRGVLLTGLCAASLAGALYAAASTVALLLVARLAHGIAEGTVFTAGLAWVLADAPDDGRGRLIGLYGISVWSGLAVGPPIGQALFDAGGYDAVWAAVALAPLAGVLLALRLAAVPPAPYHGGRRVLVPRGAILPGVGLMLAGSGIASLQTFLVLLCADRGFGGGAYALAVYATATLASRLTFGGAPDRYGPRRCMVAACAAGCLGQVLIATAHTWLVVGLGAALFGVCWSLVFPTLALLVVARVPAAERGAGLAAYSGFLDLAFGVGAPLLGVLATQAGYGAVFAATATLTGAAVLTVLPRR